MILKHTPEKKFCISNIGFVDYLIVFLKEMYIVKRGQLNCVSDDGKNILGILKEGAVFGQLAILNLSGKAGGNKHNITVRSIGYTDVYILRQEDVNDVLQEYPSERQNLIWKGWKIFLTD